MSINQILNPIKPLNAVFGNLSVAGELDIEGPVGINNDLAVQGKLEVNGDVQFDSDLNVEGVFKNFKLQTPVASPLDFNTLPDNGVLNYSLASNGSNGLKWLQDTNIKCMTTTTTSISDGDPVKDTLASVQFGSKIFSPNEFKQYNSYIVRAIGAFNALATEVVALVLTLNGSDIAILAYQAPSAETGFFTAEFLMLVRQIGNAGTAQLQVFSKFETNVNGTYKGLNAFLINSSTFQTTAQNTIGLNLFPTALATATANVSDVSVIKI